MANETSYKFPLVLAILLHILLFGFLFFKFAVPAIHQPGFQNPVNIVQASVVSANTVKDQLAERKAQELEKERQQQQLLKEQQLQLHAAQQQREKEAAEQAAKAAQVAQAAQLKAQQQQELQQKALAAQQALQKKLADQQAKLAAVKAQQEKAKQAILKQQQVAAAAKKQLAQQQKLKQELKASQQQMLQQQMAAEQQQLASAAHNQQIQTELDKYKALVVQAISQNWLVPDSTDKNLSCQLLIRVGPGGVVLNVQVLQSSGNPALDQSASTAVFKTSPLPVPTDPELFDKFRELRLTVRPENIISSSG